MRRQHIIDPDGDITICMPYFERLAPLEKTIESFHKYGYFEQNIYLSIVDDGSIREPIPERYDEYPWCTVERLEKKTAHKNPCVPMNIAVKNAKTEIILLQSPETKHITPIARKMASSMRHHKDIVLAVVSSNRPDHPWYSHPKENPQKTWWCQMMSKLFFNQVGGFREDYRDGLGFEDNDLERRLSRARGRWIWKTDCVAHHHYEAGTTGIVPGTKDHNYKVYRKYWKK